MKKTCENCKNHYTEYMTGDYPTPVCTIHGYLEELDNPYHDMDGEKCPDYTYSIGNIHGQRASLHIIDDNIIPQELKTIIDEIILLENVLEK